jgi:hypothetical protein
MTMAGPNLYGLLPERALGVLRSWVLVVIPLSPTKMPPERPRGRRECHTKSMLPERGLRKLCVKSRLPLSEIARNPHYDPEYNQQKINV